MSDGITDAWRELSLEKEMEMELRRVKKLYFELGESISNLDHSLEQLKHNKDITLAK